MCQRLLLGFLALAAVVCAQRRVDPRNTYYRVICVVPMVGAGTQDDPKRPMFAPKPAELAEANRNSMAAAEDAARKGEPAPVRKHILAYQAQISDDGQYAVVEFVAEDRAAFKGIFDDRDKNGPMANVKVLFEKGKQKEPDVEREMKRFKHNFDLDRFGVVMP